MKHIIRISRNGTITQIYSDALAGMTAEMGQPATIKRASNVEPGDPLKGQDPHLWYADLAPVEGPVLGGFVKREEAIAAEIEWLQQNILLKGNLKEVIPC